MKLKNIFKGILAFATLSAVSSCADLDLQPLTEPSSDTWNSNMDEVRISLNDLYRTYPYQLEIRWFTDGHTDDFCHRNKVYDVPAASLSSTTSWIESTWKNSYKAISRCNRVIEKLAELEQTDENHRLVGEARFFRAYFYSRLITLWGDVPFYTTSITIDEARQMGRISEKEVLRNIYEDYDYAAANLPETNNVAGLWRVNRYCALALKARIALTKEDWAIARDAAKEVIDSKKYSLYPDFGELFRDLTIDTGETIFAIANSTDLGPVSYTHLTLPTKA